MNGGTKLAAGTPQASVVVRRTGTCAPGRRDERSIAHLSAVGDFPPAAREAAERVVARCLQDTSHRSTREDGGEQKGEGGLDPQVGAHEARAAIGQGGEVAEQRRLAVRWRRRWPKVRMRAPVAQREERAQP